MERDQLLRSPCESDLVVAGNQCPLILCALLDNFGIRDSPRKMVMVNLNCPPFYRPKWCNNVRAANALI